MLGIFLDRDGVIIRKAAEGEYVAAWDEVEFLPGALDALAELVRFGFTVIVVTNQRGIATGRIALANLEDIHSKLKAAVAAHGGEISHIYYCPHDTSDECSCRKPGIGMLLRAAKEHGLRLSECWMVGDAASDITAGKNAGCKTALVTRTSDFSDWPEQPDIWADSLASVTMRILQLKEEWLNSVSE